MGNNEIGTRKQNYDSKVAAQKCLDKIRKREAASDRELIFEMLNGKMIVRERFTPKQQ
jgi:hypothetical protein